ncbi:hypothetical protein JO41_07260 [Treponema sp. OMZ 838]|uniref:hypothetical protein n=1 Tax=Treponema sp. OMZ 838 TaxID=1539298 RepID=UPI00053011E3|nr:hypothetical protein [Treponema sp. OMZ 838]AIW89614.1 hypothetical protein JO41_07260 [Treponema sp. OMZ 838]
MKKTNKIITLLLCLGLLTGCVNQYSSGGTVGNNPLDEGKEIEEKEEESKPSEDILFTKGADGKVIFKVNDTKYWSVRGYTLWKFFGEEINKQKPCIRVVKKAGASEAGYGLICYSTKTEVGQKQYRILVVLIHTDGRYSVGYAINGEYKSIVWKKTSERLAKGYGVANSISVKKAGKAIQIYFNDEEYKGEAAYTINNADEYALGEGESGVIGVISAKDKFPSESVWIEYEAVR